VYTNERYLLPHVSHVTSIAQQSPIQKDTVYYRVWVTSGFQTRYETANSSSLLIIFWKQLSTLAFTSLPRYAFTFYTTLRQFDASSSSSFPSSSLVAPQSPYAFPPRYKVVSAKTVYLSVPSLSRLLAVSLSVLQTAISVNLLLNSQIFCHS